VQSQNIANNNITTTNTRKWSA